MLSCRAGYPIGAVLDLFIFDDIFLLIQEFELTISICFEIVVGTDGLENSLNIFFVIVVSHLRMSVNQSNGYISSVCRYCSRYCSKIATRRSAITGLSHQDKGIVLHPVNVLPLIWRPEQEVLIELWRLLIFQRSPIILSFRMKLKRFLAARFRCGCDPWRL